MICVKPGCSGDITSDESVGHGIVRCVVCNSLYTIAYNPLRLVDEYAFICPMPNVKIEAPPEGFAVRERNSWGPDWGKIDKEEDSDGQRQENRD